MFSTFIVLIVPLVHAAVRFSPPTGPYNVGITQHIFNHSTQNDPVAPANASNVLLATIYYPTLSIPTPDTTAPYLDPTTSKLWGSALEYPDGIIALETWNQPQAPFLPKPPPGTSHPPTVIFSPGGGENAIMYNFLSSELASHGYTVVALDHPGETPYLQLPGNAAGIYGIDITASWPAALQKAVYEMRVSDALAVVRDLYTPYVTSINAPFNTSHFLAIGHSIGGAAAAKCAAVEPSVLGGVNLDGLFFDLPDVKKPFLMVAGEEHTPAIDPTWAPFSKNQSGWWAWVNVTGAGHQDFSDIGDWVDLAGLRNRTQTPSLGPIWAPRMDFVVNRMVLGFFGFARGRSGGPDLEFPEVVRVNGSSNGV
ncbi:alpha/beta-hydrolase [Polyplosphaeria fusca]|uniref:1-alkyl-2-acetylglycerophosphocholine esterase n=1 Tax=Polyplosphaeria fusca TaxID=682080 RepID=A0A9P4QL33_9PLEO|nr:alpha/beta-hydrolase [Polyplosphaeria fusca]